MILSIWTKNLIVKNLDRDDFKNLNQEFDSMVLGLAKRIYPYEYMSNFEKMKEMLPSK